ncbi:hypothetical protein [Curtobacterium sp. RRHDQ10]|uniref:hypothetical protein n=1 Tax=Curtobacterium phyllosphaerae TaxID=3413379 RepID=UPI003BF2605D
MITRIARTLHRREDGISLAELIVAISVSLIIVVTVGGFFLASIKAGRTGTTSDGNTRQSQNVMSTFTRYVHAATLLPKSDGTYLPSFQLATPTDVRFYAYVNLTTGVSTDKPVLVEFKVDPTSKLLMQYQWDPSSVTNGYYTFPDPGATSPTRTTTLGGPVASPTSDTTTLFSYLDANGNAIAAPGSSLGSIRALMVNLELGSATPGAPGNTHVQNTLYLFNIGYSTSTSSPSPTP